MAQTQTQKKVSEKEFQSKAVKPTGCGACRQGHSALQKALITKHHVYTSIHTLNQEIEAN